jgi:uncharacterized protein YndB with AHSA1/START domain
VSMRTEVRAIAIDAPPDVVFAYVAEPRNIPAWAPGFASAIRPDGERWIVTQGGREFAIVVRASEEHGTVDLLFAEDERRGAFSRVIPNKEGGCAYVFALHFSDGTPEEAVAAGMATVEEELRAVRAAVG